MNLGSDVFRITNFGYGSGSHVGPHPTRMLKRFQMKLLNSWSRTKENIMFLFLLRRSDCLVLGGRDSGGRRGRSAGLGMGDGIQGGGLLRGGVESVWGFRDMEPGLKRLCFGPMNQYSFEVN